MVSMKGYAEKSYSFLENGSLKKEYNGTGKNKNGQLNSVAMNSKYFDTFIGAESAGK